MNVITKYPIVKTSSNAQTTDEYRSTYSAFASAAVRRARRERRRRSGDTFGQRLKKGAQNVLKNPFVQNVLAQKLGIGVEQPTAPTTTDYSSEKSNTGLSKGAKIGIAIGAVAIIGTVIYFATKKKK